MKKLSVRSKVRKLTRFTGLSHSMCQCRQNTCTKCAAVKLDPKVS
ncbi:MAG: hypothetical protein ABSF56_00270 [Minisyncoccia bacterium]|jgi:hypothetical protein